MDHKLYNILLKLPRKNLIHLMWESLSEMQSYNGRSRTECIAIAMNADLNSNGKYSTPSLAKLKEITNNMGL